MKKQLRIEYLKKLQNNLKTFPTMHVRNSREMHVKMHVKNAREMARGTQPMIEVRS